MDVIQFTEGTTDPLVAFRALLARLVAEGRHVRLSCLHLAPDAAIIEPPNKKACVLLLIHGQINFWMCAAWQPSYWLGGPKALVRKALVGSRKLMGTQIGLPLRTEQRYQ
jgi:hypothetical protein